MNNYKLIAALLIMAAVVTMPSCVKRKAPGDLPGKTGQIQLSSFEHIPGASVYTIAGNGFPGSVDANRNAIQFNSPAAMAIDNSGQMWVADALNHSIRLMLDNEAAITFSGNGQGFHDGQFFEAQYNTPSGVAIDANGNIYIADRGNNRIRKISGSSFEVTTLAGDGVADFREGTGAGARFKEPCSITIDLARSLLYVADKGNNKIRKVTLDGIVTTLAGALQPGTTEGPDTTARFRGPTGVAVDKDGNIIVADSGNNRIRTITPGGLVSPLAGTGSGTFGDGAASLASFKSPVAVATDANGNVFVGDLGNNRIRKISSSLIVSTICGGNTAGFKDGAFGINRCNAPRGVLVDNAGNIIFADAGNHMIRMAIPSGSVVGTFAGGGGGFEDGAAYLANFSGPQGMVMDGSGNLYIADRFNNRIRKVTPAGQVTTLAGSSEPGFVDGSGAAARFRSPAGIAIDADGNLYVAEAGNHVIRKVTQLGDVTTFAGASDGKPGWVDGDKTVARFNNPVALVADKDKNVYVVDALNNRIRKITPTGQVSTFAGNGNADFKDDQGTLAMFNAPAGIVIDTARNLYVTDANNARIRKISPDANVTTLAGSMPGFQDGSVSTALFKNPGAITIDGVGDLYIIDRGNTKTRRITAAGVVSTITGQSTNNVTGYKDGAGATALFSNPSGIAINNVGTLFITDAGNHYIRWVAL